MLICEEEGPVPPEGEVVLDDEPHPSSASELAKMIAAISRKFALSLPLGFSVNSLFVKIVSLKRFCLLRKRSVLLGAE